MKKRFLFQWLLHGCLGLAVCLALSISVGAVETKGTDSLLAQVKVPMVLGDGSFEYEGTTFHHLLIPRYILERYEASEYAVYPGDTDDRVKAVKLDLYSNPAYDKNEYVTYTQVRPPYLEYEDREWIETYFDDHLAVFLKTLYLFCGLEDKEPCIDELTCYLLDCLPNASQNMRWDIEAAYKYELIKEGKQGTVNRDGTLDNMYYFAQTDPDWANEIFEFDGNGKTLRDRGCGCACAAMVISTYHNVEITPRWLRKYALDGDWPVDYGLPNEYFLNMASIYYGLEQERYGTVLNTPVIKDKAEVDMDELADQIGSKGYMAIIHVKAGAFTSQEHYMVLADYREIDGKGYFLVADPYVLQSRYGSWDQLKVTESTNEGLIYATPELLYRDCMSIILFAQDRNAFPLSCRTDAPELDWLE